MRLEIAFELYGFAAESARSNDTKMHDAAIKLAEEFLPKEQYDELIQRRIGEDGKIIMTEDDLVALYADDDTAVRKMLLAYADAAESERSSGVRLAQAGSAEREKEESIAMKADEAGLALAAKKLLGKKSPKEYADMAAKFEQGNAKEIARLKAEYGNLEKALAELISKGVAMTGDRLAIKAGGVDATIVFSDVEDEDLAKADMKDGKLTVTVSKRLRDRLTAALKPDADPALREKALKALRALVLHENMEHAIADILRKDPAYTAEDIMKLSHVIVSRVEGPLNDLNIFIIENVMEENELLAISYGHPNDPKNGFFFAVMRELAKRAAEKAKKDGAAALALYSRIVDKYNEIPEIKQQNAVALVLELLSNVEAGRAGPGVWSVLNANLSSNLSDGTIAQTLQSIRNALAAQAAVAGETRTQGNDYTSVSVAFENLAAEYPQCKERIALFLRLLEHSPPADYGAIARRIDDLLRSPIEIEKQKPVPSLAELIAASKNDQREVMIGKFITLFNAVGRHLIDKGILTLELRGVADLTVKSPESSALIRLLRRDSIDRACDGPKDQYALLDAMQREMFGMRDAVLKEWRDRINAGAKNARDYSRQLNEEQRKDVARSIRELRREHYEAKMRMAEVESKIKALQKESDAYEEAIAARKKHLSDQAVKIERLRAKINAYGFLQRLWHRASFVQEESELRNLDFQRNRALSYLEEELNNYRAASDNPLLQIERHEKEMRELSQKSSDAYGQAKTLLKRQLDKRDSAWQRYLEERKRDNRAWRESLAEQVEGQPKRQVAAIAKEHGVVFVHGIVPSSIAGWVSKSLSRDVGLVEKVKIVEALQPAISASTVKGTRGNEGGLWGAYGVLLKGGVVQRQYSGDASTSADEGYLNKRASSVSEDSVKGAIDSPARYNEFIIAKPEMAGFFINFDSTLNKVNIGELLKIIQEFKLPLFIISEGKFYRVELLNTNDIEKTVSMSDLEIKGVVSAEDILNSPWQLPGGDEHKKEIRNEVVRNWWIGTTTPETSLIASEQEGRRNYTGSASERNYFLSSLDETITEKKIYSYKQSIDLAFKLYGFAEAAALAKDEVMRDKALKLAEQLLPREQYDELMQRRSKDGQIIRSDDDLVALYADDDADVRKNLLAYANAAESEETSAAQVKEFLLISDEDRGLPMAAKKVMGTGSDHAAEAQKADIAGLVNKAQELHKALAGGIAAVTGDTITFTDTAGNKVVMRAAAKGGTMKDDDLANPSVIQDGMVKEIMVSQEFLESMKADLSNKSAGIQDVVRQLIFHEHVENVILPGTMPAGLRHAITSRIDREVFGTAIHALNRYIIGNPALMTDEQLLAIRYAHPNDPAQRFFYAAQFELFRRGVAVDALIANMNKNSPEAGARGVAEKLRLLPKLGSLEKRLAALSVSGPAAQARRVLLDSLATRDIDAIRSTLWDAALNFPADAGKDLGKVLDTLNSDRLPLALMGMKKLGDYEAAKTKAFGGTYAAEMKDIVDTMLTQMAEAKQGGVPRIVDASAWETMSDAEVAVMLRIVDQAAASGVELLFALDNNDSHRETIRKLLESGKCQNLKARLVTGDRKSEQFKTAVRTQVRKWKTAGNAQVSLMVAAQFIEDYADVLALKDIASLLVSDGRKLTAADIGKIGQVAGLKELAAQIQSGAVPLLDILDVSRKTLDEKQEAFKTLGFQA